jgi:hypothetical protein
MNAFLFEWVDSHFFEDFFKKPLYSQILDFAKNSKTLSKDDSSKLKLLFIQKPARPYSPLSGPNATFPAHFPLSYAHVQKQKPAKGRPAPVPPIRPPETFKSIDIVEVSAAAIAEQLTLIGTHGSSTISTYSSFLCVRSTLRLIRAPSWW